MYLRHTALGTFVLAFIVTLLLSSCEPAFSPIKENDRQYSIFGFLNGSADTQFVRIEKLRDSLFSDTPEELDAEVRLTNVTTGQTQLMQDSVFEYSVGKAHNYYTTLDIRPTETYLLEVINGGNTTSAQVVIPEDFPEPTMLLQTGQPTVEITDISRLIAVKAIYYASQNCTEPPCPENPDIRTFSYQHLEDTVNSENGIIHAPIDTSEDLEKVEMNFSPRKGFTLHQILVVIAAGTPNWPDFLNLDAEAAALPDVASNVDGGVGLLGGVITDSVEVPLAQ